MDSDFDIDEGDEPSSDGEAEEPRRKRRVVTTAYKVRGKSRLAWAFHSCSPRTSPIAYSASFLLIVSSCSLSVHSLVSVSNPSPGASEELKTSKGQHPSWWLSEGPRREGAATAGIAGRWR